MAVDGAIIASGYAEVLLANAIEKHGLSKPLEFPGTGYELPSLFAWDGREAKKLEDLITILGEVRAKIVEEHTMEAALAAGEVTMISAEIVEALKYIDNPEPYAGTKYCGFVPDRILRKLGIAFVDDTIPGCAVFIGKANNPEKLGRWTDRYCGDFQFLNSMKWSKYERRRNSIVFRTEIIAITRPANLPVAELWRRHGYPEAHL